MSCSGLGVSTLCACFLQELLQSNEKARGPGVAGAFNSAQMGRGSPAAVHLPWFTGLSLGPEACPTRHPSHGSSQCPC